jgi:hypothetical protein
MGEIVTVDYVESFGFLPQGFDLGVSGNASFSLWC